VDLCCGHTDTRQAVFLEDRKGRLDPWFVDMGHQFGGSDGNQTAHEFVQCRYADQRIYPEILPAEISAYLTTIVSLDADALWKVARKLPEDWVSAKALRAFFRGLETLSNKNLVRSFLQLLLKSDEAGRRVIAEEPAKSVSLLKSPGTIPPSEGTRDLQPGLIPSHG